MDRLLDRVLDHARRLDRGDWGIDTGLDGLRIFRAPRPSDIRHEIYDPVYCLVLQGAKRVVREDRAEVVGAGQAFFVPVDLPVLSRVEVASAAQPYVSLALRLDMALLAELAAELQAEGAGPCEGMLRAVPAEAAMIDAFARLVGLIDQPEPARRVLEPLVRREIHYRLIASPQCGMLRGLVRRGGPAEGIARAIRAIRRAYAEPLRVEALAREAGMSPSGFHAHFRAVTGTTPLQFQKSLRLIEARRLLQERHSVSAAAFAVGYESPTQFAREFSRRFGVPPSLAKAA